MVCDYCRVMVPCSCHISNNDQLIINSDVCKRKLKSLHLMKKKYYSTSSIYDLKFKMDPLPKVKFRDSRYKTLFVFDHNNELDIENVLQ